METEETSITCTAENNHRGWWRSQLGLGTWWFENPLQVKHLVHHPSSSRHLLQVFIFHWLQREVQHFPWIAGQALLLQIGLFSSASLWTAHQHLSPGTALSKDMSMQHVPQVEMSLEKNLDAMALKKLPPQKKSGLNRGGLPQWVPYNVCRFCLWNIQGSK